MFGLRAKGATDIPEEGQGGESNWWEVVGTPRATHGPDPKEGREHPDLTTSDRAFPTPCLATGEFEGQPRTRSEDGGPPRDWPVPLTLRLSPPS